MQVDAAAAANGDACECAKQEFKTAANWLGVFTFLVFLLTVVVVAALAAAILLGTRKDVPGALISVAGAVVSGAGARFVLARRSDAKTDVDGALAAVSSHCSATVHTEARTELAAMKVIPLLRF